MANFSVIPQLRKPNLCRANVPMYSRPPPVSGNDKYSSPDGYVFRPYRILIPQSWFGGYCALITLSAYYGPLLFISPKMSKPPIIFDKYNHGLVSDSSLLLSRKPFILRPLVTEIIEWACSTTLELSHGLSFLYPHFHPA